MRDHYPFVCAVGQNLYKVTSRTWLASSVSTSFSHASPNKWIKASFGIERNGNEPPVGNVIHFFVFCLKISIQTETSMSCMKTKIFIQFQLKFESNIQIILKTATLKFKGYSRRRFLVLLLWWHPHERATQQKRMSQHGVGISGIYYLLRSCSSGMMGIWGGAADHILPLVDKYLVTWITCHFANLQKTHISTQLEHLFYGPRPDCYIVHQHLCIPLIRHHGEYRWRGGEGGYLRIVWLQITCLPQGYSLILTVQLCGCRQLLWGLLNLSYRRFFKC